MLYCPAIRISIRFFERFEPMSNPLRLGTRGSLLARTQSQLIADEIERSSPDVKVELVIVKTTGDLVLDQSLSEIGGKGLFTKELELALLRNEIDLAVHSLKDVPITMPLVDQSDLSLAAISKREDPHDVLVTNQPGLSIEQLPQNAKIGTSSLRRKCQLLAIRPDLEIVPVRGNVDTRLRKVASGEFDATILAMAGLKRLGLFDASMMQIIPIEQMISAPGQGALAIQTRSSDEKLRGIVQVVDDPMVRICIEIEREIVRLLDGDCHSPIAAIATIQAQTIQVRAAIGAKDGRLPVKKAEKSCPITFASQIPKEITEQLK